jgi:N-acetylmuramic acid 6-phosphate (MurNAc-6-P) etherase
LKTAKDLTRYLRLIVGLANDVANPYAFIAIDASRRTVPPLKLRMADVNPMMSASAEALIEGWVYQEISAGLGELKGAIDQQLILQRPLVFDLR